MITSLPFSTSLVLHRPRHPFPVAGCMAFSSTVRNSARKRRLIISNQMEHNSNFSSSLSTDLPLRESSRVSFDQYMSDRQRIFQALFPDTRRYEKLTEDEWRIYMLPIEFLFLSVNPVVDMRIVIRSSENRFPVRVAEGVGKVLTLEVTRWDLQGLDYILKPSDFMLAVNGALYSEKRGLASRLKGHLQMSVSCTLPPSLALIPREVTQGVGEAVLIRLLQSMKEKVNSRLLADYGDFVNEKSKKIDRWRQPQIITPAA